MQNENPHSITVKEFILNQNIHIRELTERINSLERTLAVLDQKATSCDISSRESESAIKATAATISQIRGVVIIAGFLFPFLLFAASAWVKLEFANHEKTVIHYKDYFKYPEPNQHIK